MDLVQRARDLYSAGRMHDAFEAAQAACDRAPKDPEAWWLLARITRHIGLTAASDEAFRRAAALTPGRPQPYRVSVERFVTLLQDVRDTLSPDGQERLYGKALQVLPLPSAEEVRHGLDPDALIARKRAPNPQVTIFQVNHENRSHSEAALRALLKRSLSRA